MGVQIEEDMSARSKEKREIFERFNKNGIVAVQFDLRRQGVDAPEHLGQAPNMILNFSAKFADYLHLDNSKLSQVLHFPGFGDLPCTVPWSAVYAMHPVGYRGQSAIWHLDVPSELRRAFGIDPTVLS